MSLGELVKSLYKAISEGVISMSKKIHEFNDIIRKLRKELFGKGPERIHTVFVENMAVSTLYGNLSASEQFIARTPEGREMVHATDKLDSRPLFQTNSRKEWRNSWELS